MRMQGGKTGKAEVDLGGQRLLPMPPGPANIVQVAMGAESAGRAADERTVGVYRALCPAEGPICLVDLPAWPRDCHGQPCHSWRAPAAPSRLPATDFVQVLEPLMLPARGVVNIVTGPAEGHGRNRLGVGIWM